MSMTQRIKSVLIGLLMLAIGIAAELVKGEYMIFFVALFLCLALIGAGIRYIAFYFQMSRHMIGGFNQLVTGIMLIDAGLMLLSLNGKPNIFIALYLVGINVFAGGLTAYRALTQKRMGEQHWKLRFFRGVLTVLLGIGCLFFVQSDDYLMMIYGFGLIASGVLRIAEAFRPTDIVYIP